jgi:hypothetical protein
MLINTAIKELGDIEMLTTAVALILRAWVSIRDEVAADGRCEMQNRVWELPCPTAVRAH